jgi:hypothetical protein
MSCIKTIFCIFLLVTGNVTGQTDTLNKFNSKGKKDGYWLQYLDFNLLPTDSLNSYYKGFELYDNGKALYQFKEVKGLKKTKLTTSMKSVKGFPVLIDGFFKWEYPTDSIPAITKEFKNGHPTIAKYYYPIKLRDTLFNGSMEIVDYTKRYNGIRGSYYYECQRNTKVFMGPERYRKRWYYKKRNKWKLRSVKN